MKLVNILKIMFFYHSSKIDIIFFECNSLIKSIDQYYFNKITIENIFDNIIQLFIRKNSNKHIERCFNYSCIEGNGYLLVIYLCRFTHFYLIVQSKEPLVILKLGPLKAGETVAVNVPLMELDVNVFIITLQLEPLLPDVAE